MTAYQRTKLMKGLSRECLRWLGGWLAIGVLGNLFRAELVEQFFILPLAIYFLHGLLGLLMGLIWLGRSLDVHRVSPVPGALMLSAWFGLLLATPHLSRAGEFIGLWSGLSPAFAGP
ncbi:hypothetical protein [Phenylobacterium sp.]|jgi:hypothetical protein|uniref:hypothetical protein n=1 Tax=Phenylobacterium sp. TaxID=1871053 RepID=UPI002E30EB4A|nr:hypothetical protein [Phenylobacterium sp.]HEX2561830.1 hypothetical protein [Phenylobacterium sp.]